MDGATARDSQQLQYVLRGKAHGYRKDEMGGLVSHPTRGAGRS